MNKEVKITIPEKNVVIPRNVEYQFRYSIEKPIYDTNITLDYEMKAENSTNIKVFTKKVSKEIWKRIDSLEVN